MVGRFLVLGLLTSAGATAVCGAVTRGMSVLPAVVIASDEPDAPGDEPSKDAQKDKPADADKPSTTPVKQDDKKSVTAPAQVVSSASRASKAAPCDGCRGDGKATEERLGPARESVPGIRMPTRQKVEVRCKKCNGTGLSGTPRLVNEMKDFARQLAKVNDGDDRWPAASEKVLQVLRDLTRFGATTWSDLNNNKLRTMINQNKDPIGEVIFFVGKVDSDEVVAAPEGGMALRSMSIRLSGNGRGSTVFERPLVVDAGVEQEVLCGGVIARRAVEGGNFVLYIDRGYVVRFDGPVDDHKDGRK
jgi:hypothetical protein